MSQAHETEDEIVINNLMESQLQMHDDENEDFKIIENLLFATHERTYNKLDRKTSRKVVAAITSSEPQAAMIQCSHCDEVFTDDDFQMHVCTFDANHQLVPMATHSDPETELNMLHRSMMAQLVKNQKIIKDLASKKKGEKAFSGECFKCCRKFVHESGLYRHWDRHIGELLPLSPVEQLDFLIPVTLCVWCGEVFGLERDAWDHLQSHHVYVEIVRTPMREISLSEADEFKTPEKMKLRSVTNVLSTDIISDCHSQSLLKPIYVAKVFQCEFCDVIFINARSMLTHVSKHAPSSGFQCNKCELKHLNLKEMLLHRRDECVALHDIRNPLKGFPRVWVCNVCDEEFRGLEQLLEHRHSSHHFFPRIELRTNKLHFSCERCIIEFTKAPMLVSHFNEKHQKKAKPDVVAETSERIKKTATESSRGGIHQTSSRPRQYLCEVCGKSYTQSSHLWQHLRFHQGVKPFGCTVEGCNRRFTIRPDLNDHIRKCHTGERPYLCTICGKRFLTGSVYYQHRLIHRGERRYGCDECKKRFYRADALKNHLRIHSGEKPHTCSVCGKAFRQRGDRDKHIKARHPNAVVISSPRKTRIKSFGRGRIKNNTSLYCSKPGATPSRTSEQ